MTRVSKKILEKFQKVENITEQHGLKSKLMRTDYVNFI